MKVFRNLLLIGWAGLLGVVAMCFAFPSAMSGVIHPIAGYFVLIPTSLLVATGIYGLSRLYHAGMRK